MTKLSNYEIGRLASDINRQAPIRAVLEMYGLETKGNKQGNIPCPSVSHIDKTPSAKIYDKANTVYCYSEAKTFRPINIVREQENCNFFTACDILMEKFHIVTNVPYKEKMDAKELFPLNDYDYSYLGLSKNNIIELPKGLVKAVGKDSIDYVDGILLVNKEPAITCDDICKMKNVSPLEADEILSKLCSEILDNDKSADYQSDYYTISYDTAYTGLRDLFKNDKPAFEFLIYNKALEKKNHYESCLGDYRLSKKQAYFMKCALNRCNYFIDKYKDTVEKVFQEENLFDDDFENELEV